MVSTNAGAGGNISPTSTTINHGDTANFTVTPDADYEIDEVSGCGGTLSGNSYTTGPITAACTVAASFSLRSPFEPSATLSFQAVKSFHFSWADVAGETEYRLLENPDGISGYNQVASIAAGSTSYDHIVPLYRRTNARYILQACNSAGCADSSELNVSDTLAQAVGYFKASNTGLNDRFGYAVELSADGNTLAVAALLEDSNATGIDGDQADNSAGSSGAVYVFTRNVSTWSQQAYIKASNTGAEDRFGWSIALSADGNTLAVGAWLEDSAASGVNGDQTDSSASDSGAAYVFIRSNGTWTQQAYVKASNTGAEDRFGRSVSLSADGNTLAVGADAEESAATGIDGDQADNSAEYSGAVYVFTRSGSTWSQQAYVKTSNTGAGDGFGFPVALSADGNTMVTGAHGEDSAATGINGIQTDNSASRSGAAYAFVRDSNGTWSQQAYIKASNTDIDDIFGHAVALSADGNTLAVGASGEDSAATGIGGDEIDDSEPSSGATYVFTRSGSTWSQQAYIKASNTGRYDNFGGAVALSAGGNTLAVGTSSDDSIAAGIGGGAAGGSAAGRGGAFGFSPRGSTWSLETYVKAPNTGAQDTFGTDIAMSDDGGTLAVGALFEDSAATGIGGDQADDSLDNSGAVYIY
ncbi:FG-GAP repeat protein [Microbulbifer taiwanensis]|uniref:FG-GAP repeat protein n=1 Tax=Microbulbifer taiwanensis TaxID=986746 RepID=UPI001D022644|nr:FG-GAP repeat protein [Microbulbifer taiwanensis]